MKKALYITQWILWVFVVFLLLRLWGSIYDIQQEQKETSRRMQYHDTVFNSVKSDHKIIIDDLDSIIQLIQRKNGCSR